jgi:hypothetical protein
MQPYLSLVASLTLAALYAAVLLLFLLAAADVEINGFQEIHIHLLLTHFDLLAVHACGQLFIFTPFISHWRRNYIIFYLLPKAICK